MSNEWFVVPPPPCSACQRPYQPERIGISAIGWAFTFDPRRGKAEWLDYLADKRIEDEYGREYTFAQFVAFVEAKEGGRTS